MTFIGQAHAQNGICERFHKRDLEEFYHVALRKKSIRSNDELQEDLAHWLQEYNHDRKHQGKRCDGRTPYEILTEAKHLALETRLSARRMPVGSSSHFYT